MYTVRHHVLTAVFVLLLLATPARAATLYVNGAAQPGDGSSWTAPLANLPDAIAKATPGDQIWVAQGTYLPTTGSDRSASFRLREGVAIYGGFTGSEAELSKRDVKRHSTILSGDINTLGVPDDNVFHVVTAKESGILDGFTITGGYSANVPWKGRKQLTPADVAAGYHQGMGAGLLVFRAAPQIRNCVFQDNHALIGGGVYVMASSKDAPTDIPAASPAFTDCVFWQNSALAHGGGAANFLRSAPVYVSCVFDSNIADIRGGGMFNDFGSTPRLLNTIFRNNEAESGGGMANDGGSQPSLFYCTLTGNRALKSGPAIHQSGGQANTTVLIKTIVWGNECDCSDTRFFNGQMAVIRVQDSVIQGGYQGKSVFQANPGLDRKSETLLNTGYKTNGYRFRAEKLRHRLRDIDRAEVSANLPAFDPSYVAMVDPRLLDTTTTASATPQPAPAPKPMVQTTPAPIPAPTPEPVSEPARVIESSVPQPKIAKPEPQPMPTPKAAPVPVAEPEPTPEPEPAPTPVAEPEAVAMVEPQPIVTKQKPVRPDGPPTSDQTMQNLDLDGNGCITINEARGPLQQQFWRIDNNGDGCISKVELNRLEVRRAQRTATSQAKPQRQLARHATKPVQPKAKPRHTTARTRAPQPMQTAATPSAPAVTQTAPGDQTGGYTLFAPIGGNDTFLIDMNGHVVKKWTGRDRSSGAVYLLNNGNLLRSVSPAKGEVNTPFDGPGVSGGIIQEVSPRGQVVWEYAYVNKDVRQHHDIEPLPNGNVLLLAWELKNSSDIAAAGGSVRNHPDNAIWAEHIVEVRKSGPRAGTIVWEWHSWDHLVQDTDRNAPNYANPVRLPQRIDLNYNPKRVADWHHANSIDFNPLANQIVLSLRNLNEIWIIDHSTNSTQAASNTGGVMHRGGDLLFRWGDAATYGGTGRPALTGQHDAQWITGAKPGDATILIFNNGDRRTAQSDVVEIKPAYYFKSTALDASVLWSYRKSGGKPFFADHVSGAQRLANGNTLICDGTGARLFEVTANGKTVWEYEHGSTGKGPGNHIFRATRLEPSHPGIKRLGIQ